MAKPVPRPKTTPKPAAAAPKPTTSAATKPARQRDAATGIPVSAAPRTAHLVPLLLPANQARADRIKQVLDSIPALNELATLVVAELTVLAQEPDAEFGQELMRAVRVLDSTEKVAKKLTELIEAAAALHFRAKKPFSRGRYVATVELDKVGRKNPKWKDIAIIERTALCEKLGVPFEAETYEKDVLARTDAGKKDSVTILEIA